MRPSILGLAALAACFLSGCAALGPAEEADGRKLTWFSYVNGEDLRDQCAPDTPDRYRLVYNAQSHAQLRTYEVRGEAGDPDRGLRGGAVIEARAIPSADLSRRDPAEVLQPESTQISRVRLSSDQFESLTLKLAASGVFDGPPIGLRLQSGGIFWLASGCHEGEYFVTAFTNPSEQFESIGLQ
jgi:hypothetical protein